MRIERLLVVVLLCSVLCASAWAQDADVLHPRITVITFDPILTTQGNQRLHAFKGWASPRAMMDVYLDGMEYASHGLMTERMTHYIDMDFWPVKIDGFQYTEPEYLAGNWHSPDGVDYHAIARDYNLARKVDRGEIDEVKIYGAPYFGYWESTMCGVGGYWCNSSPQQQMACSKIFIVMGWNYERSVSLHATGHRAESIMEHVYGSWDITQDRHLWERFTHNIGQSPQTPACGTAHFPPNGVDHYDYANPQTVMSTSVDWYVRFPNLTGQTSPVNRNTWGEPWEFNYFKWWYRHMPHVAGRNNWDGYDRLNNWWEYLFNCNEHPESGGQHLPGGTPPAAQPSPATPQWLSNNTQDDWAPQVNPAGRAVWYGSDGEDYEIYASNVSGSGFVQITDNAFSDEAPEINAAGQIVWQAFDGQDYEIFTANADGTGLVQVTNNATNDWHPDISDTGRIVWDGWDGEDYEVFSANVDGTDVTQLTNNSHAGVGKPRDDVWPRINASNRVVWAGYDNTDFEIYSADADGSNAAQLSDNYYVDEFPQISDGGKVVWHTWHNTANAEIYSSDASGGGAQRLTSNSVLDWWPRVNAAGDVVWMERMFDAEHWDVMLRPAGSSSTVNVTSTPQHEQYPVIDEEGRIFWQGFDGTDWEIYALIDGTTVQLSDNEYDNRAPAVACGFVVWHGEAGTGDEASSSEIIAVSLNPSSPGDLDCDGDVDFDDINPFVLALGGEAGYLAEYPDCNWLNADCNDDGNVDFDDINPFVALIGS